MAKARNPADGNDQAPDGQADVCKHATWLYHPTEAPAGKLFAEGDARPGAGWADSPAEFVTADD